MQELQITEEQINKHLVKGLRAYFSQLKKGNKELADLILSITSKTADLLLDDSGIRKNYKKVYCNCGRQLTSGWGIEFYKQTGRCVWCSHLEEDIQDLREVLNG